MKKLIIASLYPNSGKTSFIAGLGAHLGRVGYLKPFGDRLFYRDKQMWDYDAELMVSLMGLQTEPGALSIGFDHSKLRLDYTPKTVIRKIQEQMTRFEDRDMVIIETGGFLATGRSLGLDAISLSHTLEAGIILVTSGTADQIIDDMDYLDLLNSRLDTQLLGLVINKIHHKDQFREKFQQELNNFSLPVWGMIPRNDHLNRPTISTILELLHARVIAGTNGMQNRVAKVFVGAMSGDSVMRMQSFRKPGKLIITSGDRSDMILAAIETGSAGVILTNDLLPPANIIAKASANNIPLILVPNDTYNAAKRVEHLVSVTRPGDDDKLKLLNELVEDHVQIQRLLAAI